MGDCPGFETKPSVCFGLSVSTRFTQGSLLIANHEQRHLGCLSPLVCGQLPTKDQKKELRTRLCHLRPMLVCVFTFRCCCHLRSCIRLAFITDILHARTAFRCVHSAQLRRCIGIFLGPNLSSGQITDHWDRCGNDCDARWTLAGVFTELG